MGGAWRLNSVVLAISVVGLRVVGALPGIRLRLRKVPEGIRRGGRHGSKGGGGEGAEGEGEVEEVRLSEPPSSARRSRRLRFIPTSYIIFANQRSKKELKRFTDP